MRVPTPSPLLVTPGGIALSDSEKAEAFADNLETQFQSVTDILVPEFIEMVDEALRSYFMTSVSELNITKPKEIQKAIRGVRDGNAPGPNGFPKRELKHLPRRAAFHLVLIVKAFPLTHQFPTARKLYRMISIPETGKDQALSSFHRPIRLL